MAHKIIRAKSHSPALLNHHRPGTFSAACPGCGRTLLGLFAAVSAGLPTVFAAVTVVVLVSLFPATVEGQTPECSETSAAITNIDSGVLGTNADLSGLVADCTKLLGLKDELIGTDPGAGSLNWVAGIAMDAWDGITVSGSPPRVRELYLSSNQLSGVIPPALGSLENLRYLSLSDNQLSGEIPKELGNLTNLRDLLLDGNQLAGPIPKELGNLAGLASLGLNYNRLSGSIPTQLGNLTRLVFLYLNGNMLSGGIPEELGNLTSVHEIVLHQNQLTGPIPSALSAPVELTRLWLYDTNWTGSIPPELLAKTELDVLTLDLRTNRRPTAPVVEDQILTVGEEFTYQVVFSDPDGQTLTYTAMQAGDTPDTDTPLPAWLTIDPTTGTLSGTPPTEEPIAVRVIAEDTPIDGSPALSGSVTFAITPGGDNGSGGGGSPRQTVPDAPRNLLADGGDAAVTLAWDPPKDDGGAAITDYEYRINRRNPWISIGSTNITHTVSGLDNGTAYVFEVRAVNRIGKSFSSNRAEATPEAPEVFTLDFAHFANGTGITSEMVLVNVATHPSRPAIYFYDTEGALVAPESVVEVTGDLEVTEDGSLTVLTAMEPLGELTISTHGQGELVSGSVKVLSDGPIGGGVRYGVPEIGVAGVGASEPVRDILFPARSQAGGIRTAAALHNLGAEAMGVTCRLMSGGVSLEEAGIPLEAHGQTSWFIEDTFTATDTSDFLGSVRCTAPGRGRFTAIAVEMDAAERIFNTLSVVPVDRTAGRRGETVLDFAHFANGTWITDLVFVNLETQPSGPAPTPYHVAIPPSRPAIYFYDTEGALVSPESVVNITGDLEVTEDGALTVQTEMEPLGVLTISTHGQGELVSGSVRVVSEGPIGGMLRFEHPALGVAGVGASQPVSDALFPVRRQKGGITTGVALHNLESSPGLLRCDLMREGVLLDAASIPLEANGQTAWLIDQAFPAADTSDFSGSVRCDAAGEGMFSAVVLEMDPGNRIFTTLPVVPVPEMPDRE